MRLPEPRSLRLRLLLTLLIPLVALTAAGVLLDYRSARALLGASHDRALASTAIGLAARVETDRDGDLPAHLVATMRAVSRLSEADELVYLVLDGAGRRIAGDPQLAALGRPAEAEAENPLIYDAELAGRPVRAASYAYVGPEGQATVIVAEALGKRRADARRILLTTMVTNVVMALAMAGAAAVAVAIALRPLDALGQRVEGHAAQALRPMLLRGLPRETRPLVRAINRLMARLRRTLQARQQFIDNTAHQLRTPLAGLQAQVTLLASEPMPAPALARVADLREGVHRLAHLTHQMLSLARAGEHAGTALQVERVALPDLLEQTASQCLDAAIARQTDLGFEAAPATVQGSPWMLRELVLNLVDNAIAHSPPGSAVTVRCGNAAGRPFVEVEDNGPGIPVADRARVFDRHVRLAGDGGRGTGLGLAIVREIADRHHASVSLGDSRSGQGLRVRLDFRA
jgi:two-component system, OmpR family, sensor histidine kinase TctE